MADASRLAASGHRPTALTVGSLFAGIGGFDLAAKWMGWRTAWFSEIDPYASAVLAKHWPDVPNHGDITRIDFTTVEPVDVLCGGFPCQDISNAGRMEGIDGERSGLWREYARAIRELRPRYVVVENVSALLVRGLDRVLGSLAALGYDAWWDCIPASAVGAPHQRDRVWIVAYHAGDPVEESLLVSVPRRSPQQPGRVPWLHVPGNRWGADQPPLVGVVHGLPHQLDEFVPRAKSLGNTVVPECALVLFRAIQAAEARRMRETLDDAA